MGPRSNDSFSSSSTSRSSMSRRPMLGSRNDSFNSSSLQRADSDNIHNIGDVDDPMASYKETSRRSIGHILAGDHASTTALNMMDQLDFSVQAKSSKSSSSSIHSSAMSSSDPESVILSGSFLDVFDEAEMKSDF